jgi:hypothetical protein
MPLVIARATSSFPCLLVKGLFYTLPLFTLLSIKKSTRPGFVDNFEKIIFGLE